MAHFPQKRYFGKVDCYYCMSTVFFHTTKYQKNPQRSNHNTESSIILAQTECELHPQKLSLVQKGIFFWKID